jgi:hypothetical protein
MKECQFAYPKTACKEKYLARGKGCSLIFIGISLGGFREQPIQAGVACFSCKTVPYSLLLDRGAHYEEAVSSQ